jgi:hypothetical protein
MFSARLGNLVGLANAPGDPAPLIATTLFASYHSGYAISIYIAACAVVSWSRRCWTADGIAEPFGSVGARRFIMRLSSLCRRELDRPVRRGHCR